MLDQGIGSIILDRFELQANQAQTRCSIKVGLIILTVLSFNQTWLKLDVRPRLVQLS